MNDMTTKQAVLHSSQPGVPMHTHPDGRGRYRTSISYSNGMVTLSLRYVERPWLPHVLFGRVIQTKMCRISGDDVRQMSMVNDAHGLCCIVALHGGAEETISMLGSEWPMSMREAVRTDIDGALHKTSRGLSFKLNGRTAILAALLVAYAVIQGLSGVKQQYGAEPVENPLKLSATSSALTHLTPIEAAGMSSAAIAQASAEGQENPMPIKEALGQASKITVRAVGAGGKSLIVWSDPLCPNCRDLEQKILPVLPANVGVTVIPVSFKHGSRPLVAYTACAPTATDAAERWKNLMSLQPTDMNIAAQCEYGASFADSNTSLFARAGLRATPTLMRSDGQVFEGDPHSAEEIASWVAK